MSGYLVELSVGTAIVLLGRPTGGGAGIITNDTPNKQHHDHLTEQHSTFSWGRAGTTAPRPPLIENLYNLKLQSHELCGQCHHG